MTDQLDGAVLGEPLKTASYKRNILSVVRGGGITLFGKLFTNASRFVTALILARFIGAEQYGLYQLALNTVTLVSGIALLGLDTALVRFVAIADGRREDKRLWGVLQIGIGIPAVISVITGVGLFALAYPIAENIFHDMRLVPLLQLISLVIPTITMSDVLVGAVRGFKNMEYPVLAQFIVQPAFRLVATLLIAFSGLDAFRAIVIFGLSDLIATLMLVFYLNKLFPLRRPLFPAVHDLKGVMSYAFPDWLAGMLDKFRFNIQALLIGSLNNIAGVGIFAVADQINILGHDFYTSINISARPLIAQLHDLGERIQLARVYQTATKWSVIVNLPLFLLIILFPVELLSIFGASFTGGAAALIILAWANLVDIGTGMCGTILNMTGYTRLKLVNNIISLSLSILLNFLLIPRMGIVGAALSVLIVQTLLNLTRMAQVYYLIHLQPYNWSILKPIGAGLVTFACIWYLKQNFFGSGGLLNTAILAIVLCAIFAALILLLGLSAEDRMILKSIQQKAQKKLAGRRS